MLSWYVRSRAVGISRSDWQLQDPGVAESLCVLSTNGEQHGDVLSHFADQGGISLGVEFRFTRGPIQTFQLIDEHSTFNLVNLDRQRERIGLAFACQRTNNG